MGYWLEVRDVLKKGVDLALTNLKETTDNLEEKTKEVALSAKVKTKLFLKQRELNEFMADLGDAVYDLYKDKKDIYTDEKIKDLIDKADEIINECKAMASEAGIEHDKFK